MRRFLACIVAVLMQGVVAFVASLAVSVVLWLLNAIHSLSALVFYIVLFFGGASALGALGSIAVFGSLAVHKVSNAVLSSREGERFSVAGWLTIVLYGLGLIANIYCIFRGIAEPNTAHSIVVCLIMLFEAAILIATRKDD